MAHRKYEAPRHGSLGFLPKKRCKKGKGKIKSFPKDNSNISCHLTASIAYKAGMTHVVREVNSPGSKLNKKDIVEAVTIIETPPTKIVGIVGYLKTARGLRSFKTVWTTNLPDNFRRNYYKNWYKSKKKAFSKSKSLHLNSKVEDGLIKIDSEKELKKIRKYCSIIRCIGASSILETGLKRKKCDILEIQINGGTFNEKVDFSKSILGKDISISDIFSQDEIIDVIGITKGKGFAGVITRWGVTKLPRKTHRGARKVACVGSWHPSRVSYTVPRAGQNGYHHRTQINLKIYRIGKSSDSKNAFTDFENTPKNITPMGGFPRYGIIKTDFLIIRGCLTGPKKRVLTLRKSLSVKETTDSLQNTILKFIDTSSKWGHGRFQTSSEKNEFFESR
jgi:large subunit ribosomal protein L3e|mmetsp:Transcript_19811/g.29116  ORF Transcript_19811/g.29116 Transcript_19811/m.29116 type:complete len:391 (-) Transcript_19811:1237-2409(-)